MKLVLLTDNIVLTIERCDTLRPLGIQYRPFAYSVHDTKFYTINGVPQLLTPRDFHNRLALGALDSLRATCVNHVGRSHASLENNAQIQMIAGVPPMPTGTKYRAPLSRFICTTSVSIMSVYPSWGLPILNKIYCFHVPHGHYYVTFFNQHNHDMLPHHASTLNHPIKLQVLHILLSEANLCNGVTKCLSFGRKRFSKA